MEVKCKEKPSFIAMKTVIEQFRGNQTIGRVNLVSVDDYMLFFQKNNEIKFALWSTTDKHNIILGNEVKLLHGVNYLGKLLTELNSSDNEISDEPTYVKLEKPYYK